MRKKVSHERWRFAQDQQRIYQEKKAAQVEGDQGPTWKFAMAGTRRAVVLLEQFGFPVSEGAVVEVGSGAHGLIWCWPAEQRIAIDPLAGFYRERFAFLQQNCSTIITAQGERLPLRSSVADITLSDNVLDHVQDPGLFLRECRRILKASGVLYLAVNVHHPLWGWAGRLYNLLFRWGFRRVTPAFPSHPFHFSESQVERLINESGFRILPESVTTRKSPDSIRRKSYDLLKHSFFKNARFEILAIPD